MTDASQEGTLAVKCDAKLFHALDTMLAAKVWSEHTDVDTAFMAKQAREAVFDLLRSRGVPIDALEHARMEECNTRYYDEAARHWQYGDGYRIVPDTATGESE